MTSQRHKIRLLASATAAVIASSVAGAAPAGAVAHGEVVPQGRYRFAAQLTMTGIPGPTGVGLASVCSGALIAPSWIITAGHCFVDPHGAPVSGPVPYPTTATVGSANLAVTDGQHRVAVTEVHQAPGTDIALGRLAQPIRDVAPIALTTTAPEEAMTLRIVGWGATGSLLPLPAIRLRTGLVTVSGVTGDTVGVRGLSPARDTSACLYDSGAPYFTERSGEVVLVSVESDGPPCPHAEEETTARVDTVAPWIRRTLRAHAP
jgi:hypothetical protein